MSLPLGTTLPRNYANASANDNAPSITPPPPPNTPFDNTIVNAPKNTSPPPLPPQKLLCHASASALFDNITAVIEYQSPSLAAAKKMLLQCPSGGGHRRRERSREWWRVSSAMVAAETARRPR
ncbi:hypothetical protein Syun_029427 [Stephania yunnanensis]|uniref:Uncharacterized protein n=1 Tax=Stephania yunnanensis TaxID=152371 RepID=A0AAP0E8K6_9MAGN